MNIDMAVEIVHLAVSLVETQTSGSRRAVEDLGRTLSEIVRVAAQAYEDHTGEPLDPSLILAEEELRELESRNDAFSTFFS